MARRDYARGGRNPSADAEADAALAGLGLRLSPSSPSRTRLVAALRAAAVEAAEAMQRRHQGAVVVTPQAPSAPSASAPLLSEKVKEWIAEKSRADWSEKAQDDHRHWLGVFAEIAGDNP